MVPASKLPDPGICGLAVSRTLLSPDRGLHADRLSRNGAGELADFHVGVRHWRCPALAEVPGKNLLRTIRVSHARSLPGGEADRRIRRELREVRHLLVVGFGADAGDGGTVLPLLRIAIPA